MRRDLERQVRDRAGHACEYCRLPQGAHAIPFEIDHVIAQQHGGQTVIDNLALSCLRCNKRKGTNLSSIDPDSGAIVVFFNPRRERWRDHFEWNGSCLTARSPAGRATIALPRMNQPAIVALREVLIAAGMLPPAE